MPKFEDQRQTRSGAYQWKICEVNASDEFLQAFDNSHSIYAHLNPYQYNEEYLDLEDQLKARTRELINQHMTPRQKDILYLYFDGYTQCEIAKILNVNQSSVTKSLRGNTDYNKGKKVYGGSEKKLKKLVREDQEIQNILAKMEELIVEVW